MPTFYGVPVATADKLVEILNQNPRDRRKIMAIAGGSGVRKVNACQRASGSFERELSGICGNSSAGRVSFRRPDIEGYGPIKPQRRTRYV